MSVEKPLPEEQPLKEKEEQTKDSKSKFDERTWYEKLCIIKKNITVEPIMACLIIPSMLARLATQNLNLEKTCRIKLALEDHICTGLIRKEGNYTMYEKEVQKLLSSIEQWKSVVHTSIPLFLIIFMGAWTDRTGNRKICILLPILGEMVTCISNIVSTYFFDEIPVEVTMFFEAFFPAITGGWVMMYLGVFSYISDVTDSESRTFRVGLVNLCMTAGIPIGTALSGILLKITGYYGIFTISGLIYLLNFFYGFVYLKSNTKPHSKENEKKDPITCATLFTLVKETATVAFKKREGNIRKKIILTLLVVAILYGPGHGERIVYYMYLRYKLGWNAVMYSIYSTYSIVTHSIGALFSISIFSKRWGFHDSLLCLISTFSGLASSVCTAFIQNNFQAFMVPLVEILNATTWTSLRSMASKLVPSEEMGKMNSLFSLVESMAALCFDPTYPAIYRRTLDVFPGAVFIFSAITNVPAIILLVWFFIQHRQELKEKKKENELEAGEEMYTKSIAEVIEENITEEIIP